MTRPLFAALLLPVSFLAGGCAPVVQPRVSSAEFMTAGSRSPGRVDLFITEQFRTHRVQKTDISELKTWDFELGPVAVDAFRFALESRFEDVNVHLGTPQLPLSSGDSFHAVVEPGFASFSAADPVLFRFENYKATVSFNVSVRDPSGKTLLSQTYSGEGAQQGSIGYADPGHAAYPVAVQNAVKDATNRFVSDLVGIANGAGAR